MEPADIVREWSRCGELSWAARALSTPGPGDFPPLRPGVSGAQHATCSAPEKKALDGSPEPLEAAERAD